MKRFFTRSLTILGGITLFMLVLIVILAIVSWFTRDRVPDRALLELDLGTEIVEYVPDDPMARTILGDTPRLIDMLGAITKAGDDPRIRGIVAKIDNPAFGLATIQELRNAIVDFRKTGKPAVAYTDTFGEFSAANGAYYLATAFDQIYLQPSGDLGLTGLIMENLFLKGTLEKLGITPRLDHRKQYKNAMNIFTEKKYTDAHREAAKSLMNSRFENVVKGISATRNLEKEEVRDLFDHGLFPAQKALDFGFVDKLMYRDEVFAELEKNIGKTVEKISWSDYILRDGLPYAEGKNKIAIIYGVGTVTRGNSGFDPLSGGLSMGSDTITKAFRNAAENKNVKAIIFRIDSPGGSYVASDSIWREVLETRESGIPVIVSMGNLAASGGYFVAMGANKILAQPGTITGSIGVLGGKMVTTKLWEKLGISWDEVHTSKNSTFWSGTHDYTPEQWAVFQSWLDRIYEDFTEKVGQGRNMSIDKVKAVAKGRIWSGDDARRVGLVDQLGGFREAIELAREASGISETEKFSLVVYPKKKTLLDLLTDKFLAVKENSSNPHTLVSALKSLQPYFNVLAKLGLTHTGVLSLPPEYIYCQ